MTDSCFQERDCPADQRATSHTRFNFFLIDYTHHLAPEWKYNTKRKGGADFVYLIRGVVNLEENKRTKYSSLG